MILVGIFACGMLLCIAIELGSISRHLEELVHHFWNEATYNDIHSDDPPDNEQE